jgi:hypothetical protein
MTLPMKGITTFARRVFGPIGPQWYLAVLLVIDGLMVLYPIIQRVPFENHGNWIDDVLYVINTSSLLVLPQVVVAVGLATMAVGILLRARVAWALSIVLLAAAAAIACLARTAAASSPPTRSRSRSRSSTTGAGSTAQASRQAACSLCSASARC